MHWTFNIAYAAGLVSLILGPVACSVHQPPNIISAPPERREPQEPKAYGPAEKSAGSASSSSETASLPQPKEPQTRQGSKDSQAELFADVPLGKSMVLSAVESRQIPLLSAGYQIGIGQTKDLKAFLLFQGSTPIVIKDMVGPEKPFQFKGGKYPGKGGTCGQTVTNECTLVLTFTPEGVSVDGEDDRNLIYRDRLTLVYEDQEGLKKTLMVLEGKSTHPPRLNVQLNDNFGSTTQDTPVLREIQISLPASGMGITNRIDDLDIPEDLDPPFSLLNSTCGASLASGESCRVTVQYQPKGLEAVNRDFTIRYMAGQVERSETLTFFAERWEPQPARHLLLVGNRDSKESLEILDYYKSRRPGFASANTLIVSFQGRAFCGPELEGEGAPCPDPNVESASPEEFEQQILQPFRQWLEEHPDKDIRHVVLMPGLPSRIVRESKKGESMFGTGYPGAVSSVQHALARSMTGDLYGSSATETRSYNGFGQEILFTPELFPGTPAIVTQMYMGSVAATKAYIDKIQSAYQRTGADHVVVSGSQAGIGGDIYYISDFGLDRVFKDKEKYENLANGESIKKDILAVNADAEVLYRGLKHPKEHFGYGANDVVEDPRGYYSWGKNGYMRTDWVYDIRFGERSTWYLILTVESFNGLLFHGTRTHRYQSHYPQWFSENAFKGDGYANTPVGGVAHITEPGRGGVNDAGSYFSHWEQGAMFIECAWASKRTSGMIAIGDPWVRK